MNNKDWWAEYGPFKPWCECPTRPDPGEVLLFYLAKSGIGPDEQVPYLIELLDLQKLMAYTILKGEGLDTIAHCRILVQALKIHPPLLGIDARYYPIERHAYWWQNQGFSFSADEGGYPLLSEVIVYLRLQRIQRDIDERTRIWTQEDLANACGFKKEAIFITEHDRNPLILENMGRRAIMASVLGTLAGDQEPTIYRLFGLDPQAYGVLEAPSYSIPEVHFLPEKVTDETLHGYDQTLAAFFAEYSTSHAQNVMEEALECLRRLVVLLPKAASTTQHIHLLVLQCRYHQLLSAIARDQCQRDVIAFHTDRAVALAEQAMTILSPGLGDQALFIRTSELLAAALLWRAEACYEPGEYAFARTDIDRALSLLPYLQSNQLKVHIVVDAGLIHAHTGENEIDRALVLSCLHLAAQLHAPNQFRSASATSDSHCVRADTDGLYLRKEMALCVPNTKGTTAELFLNLLEMAQRFIDPAMIRQHIIIEVFRAQIHFKVGDYELATEYALSALEKSRQICSRLNRDHIEELYHQLRNTAYRDKPRLAYLGMKLHTWAYRMETERFHP